MSAAAQIGELVRTLGVYPTAIADDWTTLPPALMDLYADRVAQLPWIPKDWIAKVAAVHGKYNADFGARVVLLPATQKTLDTYGTPSFLNSAEKIAAWNQLGYSLQQAYQMYTLKRADEGRELIQAANAKAEFWNKLWQFTEDLEHAGSNVLGVVVGVGAAGLLVYLLTRKQGN